MAKHWRICTKKTSTPISQISDNTNRHAKVLCSTQKQTITNAQNPKVSKPNCFSKAKKKIVKATPNAPTEAVNLIVKTVHSENKALSKASS